MVPLSPSQLLTLKEMEENNLQQDILSVESQFEIGVNATSSEMQDSLPQKVVPLPNQNLSSCWVCD